jgi:hypothetical protein
MTPEMVDVALKWGTKRSEWAELLTAAPAAPEPAAQEPIKLSDDVRDFLTAWISSALEDDDREFARQLETLLGPLYTAPPAAEQPDSARSILTDEDMHRLRRFQEICEDSDACGHDLPKEAVKWLERAGALRSCGFGRHEVTLFGDYLLGKESEA